MPGVAPSSACTEATHAAHSWPCGSILPTLALPHGLGGLIWEHPIPRSRHPRQPLPTCHWQQLCRCLESCPRCLLPTCGTWLGMNVAKQGGSAPARSRHGERHTQPCALSQGGPGRRQGQGRLRSRGDVGGHQAGRCPASWARHEGAVAMALPTAMPARRVGQSWAQLGTVGAVLPELSPRCPCGERLEQPPQHQRCQGLGQGDAESAAADEPERDPARAGAGQEINSGVSSCPGQGGAGEPLNARLPHGCPSCGVAAGCGY